MAQKDMTTPFNDDALQFHANRRPGKLEIKPTKPLTTQRDLSLAYSPGVAIPCLEIEKKPDAAYDYTAKGNLVAVISNGTAVLGLGNLGALASKPVMEGKAVLFKRFADIDGIDLEVDTQDVDEFIQAVRYLGPSFGGINLEDIKAPECFIIEQKLREVMDIPVFHDDQHGTAIIAAAGILNALHLTGRTIRDMKMVVNGAGAAAIACVELVKALGLPHENVILCDTRGVIYKGRSEGMNQWKSAHAVDTPLRTLAEAMQGADVFFGLSAKGAVTAKMVQDMAAKPIIFAMANPDPEITPEDVKAVRDDAIIATGRSDYNNQVNNVLGFPYIFRGALDCRAKEINEEMKIAAARAIAELAREDVPDEVEQAYSGRRLVYGPDYIIPVPFDPRLMTKIPPAVARAAAETGVARRPITDAQKYAQELAARLDPTAVNLQLIQDRVRHNPKRIVFAEGEEEKVIRAAMVFKNSGLGDPILIGRAERVKAKMLEIGFAENTDLEIHNARLSDHNQEYTDFLYQRLQRQGYLRRDCQRLVNQDRNVFAACMVAKNHADGIVSGLTRSFHVVYNDLCRVIDQQENVTPFTFSLQVINGRTLFIADTYINEVPDPEILADIAEGTAAKARQMGHTPRVAFLSFSNFGNPPLSKALRIREAVKALEKRHVDFEFDGEMSVDVALDHDLMQQQYPFCRLSEPANILIMPALHSANITAKMFRILGGGTSVGPFLVGLSKPAFIVPMNANVSEMVTGATIAAYDAIQNE